MRSPKTQPKTQRATWIYSFGIKKSRFPNVLHAVKHLSPEERFAEACAIVGSKGAGLCAMHQMGIPVPPGFSISIKAAGEFLKSSRWPTGFKAQVTQALRELEVQTGKSFAKGPRPLFLSVRSGARVSMPGMMDTLLNLGVCTQSLNALQKQNLPQEFLQNLQQRFCLMYANVVLGVPVPKVRFASNFENNFKKFWQALDHDPAHTGCAQNPQEQLWQTIQSVFRSFWSTRATHYRKLKGLEHELGTGVHVQAMVFGNKDPHSGTGVLFSRNPSTGKKELFGEYLPQAQGEDIVAGLRTPQTLQSLSAPLLKQLNSMARKLEKHFGDMQDIEFTVESGKLWFLQTRSGQRSPQAAFKIARQMVQERLIKKPQAVLNIRASHVERMFCPKLNATHAPITKGLGASPGGMSGVAVFNLAQAQEYAKKKRTPILLKHCTSPEDVKAMQCSGGILTAVGGMTSHAAVVARGMGKCCVVGAQDLKCHPNETHAHISGQRIKVGDPISIEGESGKVFLAAMPVVKQKPGSDFKVLMQWIKEYQKKIRPQS